MFNVGGKNTPNDSNHQVRFEMCNQRNKSLDN